MFRRILLRNRKNSPTFASSLNPYIKDNFMGISIWQLLILLLIIILLFGTKKLKNIGSDLGDAINSFRRSMRDSEKEEETNSPAAANKSSETPVPQNSGRVVYEDDDSGRIIKGQVTDKQTSQT